MAKRSFRALLNEPIEPSRSEPAQVNGRNPAPTSKPSKEAKGSGEQHYSELVVKNTRLRPDQLNDLTAIARRLQIKRGAIGSQGRITENTLIRAAVDLLLGYGDRLEGAAEQEILESLINLAKGGK